MALMTHRAPSTSALHTYAASSSTCMPPPPTCNLLDAAQRSRLIRSSRKLQKVLGATPYVLEEFEPTRDSISTPSSSRSASPVPKRSTDTVAAGPSSSTNPSGLSTSVDYPYNTNSRAQSKLDALSRCRSVSSMSTLISTTASETDSTAALVFSSSKRESLAPPPAGLGRQASFGAQQPILRLPSLAAPAAAAPSSPSRIGFMDTSKPEDGPEPSSPTSSSTSSTTTSSPLTPTDSTMPLSDIPEIDNMDSMDFGLEISAVDEARIRKRRMEKLMRHLGECVPSELVFGPAPSTSKQKQEDSSGHRRPATAPTSMSAPKEDESERLSRPQLKQLRRTSVSIVSGHSLSRSASALSGSLQRRSPSSTVHEEEEWDSDSKMTVVDEFGAVRREDSISEGTIHHLMDDEWTPAAYQDVVRRLRALK